MVISEKHYSAGVLDAIIMTRRGMRAEDTTRVCRARRLKGHKTRGWGAEWWWSRIWWWWRRWCWWWWWYSLSWQWGLLKAFICCPAQTWKRRTLIRIGFSIASEVTPPRDVDDDDDEELWWWWWRIVIVGVMSDRTPKSSAPLIRGNNIIDGHNPRHHFHHHNHEWSLVVIIIFIISFLFQSPHHCHLKCSQALISLFSILYVVPLKQNIPTPTLACLLSSSYSPTH